MGQIANRSSNQHYEQIKLKIDKQIELENIKHLHIMERLKFLAEHKLSLSELEVASNYKKRKEVNKLNKETKDEK